MKGINISEDLQLFKNHSEHMIEHLKFKNRNKDGKWI